MIAETKFFFASCEVKDFGRTIVGAGKEFKTCVREREISNAGAAMGLELIFLGKFYVRIYNKALFVSRNNKLVIIGYADRLHSCLACVYGALTCKAKF